MVLQNAHIFSGTIMDNIRYGNLQASDDELMAAAKLAGAHEFVSALESGYQTQVGEAGSQLSAGQKQLISFARAVIADSQILIMDEATSSIDTETETQIQRGIENLMAQKLSIIIAHRLATIRNADRIIVVAGGEIIEQGNHHSLMAHQGHYFELYKQQSLQEREQQPRVLT
jgi:ATP-binding cassette subfamily B protein